MANIELDGANKKIKVDSGDLTLDVPGDIVLDADGANVTFKDGGTSVLDISNSSTDAVLTVSTQDKDLIIKGDDGGAAITALTVDMSAAGQFHFKDGTAALPIISNAGDTDTGLLFSAANTMAFSAGGTSQFTMADGVIAPVTDNDVDIGTSSLEFKDGYFDGTLHCDVLDLAGTEYTSIGGSDPSSADGDSLGTASAEWSDLYLADGSVIYFGNDQEITLTHSADSGLLLKHTATADDKPINLVLQTGETDMAADDVIGKISFQAPDEGTGTDAILVSGAIQAVAEGDHSSSSNATRLEFMTGASEAATAKMSISSGGIVGMGATLPGDLGVGLHIKTADSGGSVSTDADELVLENSAGVGMTMLGGTGNDLCINFGDSGDNNIGRIIYANNGNNMMFHTNDAERMRIDSSGNFKYGTTGDFGGTKFHIKLAFNAGRGLGLNSSDGAAGGGLVPMIYFGVEDSAQGSVNAGGGSVQYNTSSDYRRKENITNLTGAIDRVKTLKPYRFNFKDDPNEKVRDGFLAHEVDAIVPEAVSGEKDEVQKYKEGQDIPEGKSVGDNILDKDGNTIPEYQGLDHSKLVPVLTAAIIELEARVKTLEG
jgi:hypothetical protein